jgi:DNA invertase Pin-like site-specific DNA recombinase
MSSTTSTTTTTSAKVPPPPPLQEPKQVHIYIRVSSKGQNQPEYGRVGMDTQNAEVLKFCMSHNLYVKSCTTEVGSAYHTATPKLTKLIEKLKPGVPIMVYSFNRFSRNVEHAKEMVQAVHAKGSYIWSATDQMTSRDPGFMSLIQAAENESRLLGQRISSAHQRIRAQGGFMGKKPFGYNKVRVDGVFKLQENKLEQKIMKKLRELSKTQSPTKVLAIAMKKYPRYHWTPKMISDCIYDSVRTWHSVTGGPAPSILPSAETSEMDEMIDAIEEVEEEVVDTDNVFIVKRFHKIRIQRGVYELLVEWEGSSKCTWENVVSLNEDVPEMVAEFLEKTSSGLVSEVRRLL